MDNLKKHDNLGFIPLIGLVILLAVAIIAAGSIIYVSKYQTASVATEITPHSNTNSQNSNVNGNDGSNSNINSPTLPAGWQSYSSAVNGYSIGYPASWVHDAESSDGAGMMIFREALGGQWKVQITVAATTKTLAQAANENTTNNPPNSANVQIDSQSAIKRWYPVSAGMYGDTFYYVINNDKLYTIIIGEGAGSVESQMIQTFQFADDVSAVPADWPTYANTAYGYSIRYPSAWSVTEKFGQESVQLLPPGVNETTMSKNDQAGAITISTKAGGDVITGQAEVFINGLAAVHGLIPGIVTFDVTRFINQEGREFDVRWSQAATDDTYSQVRDSFRFTD